MQTIDEFARAKRNEYERRWREKHREQYNAHQRKRNAENKSKRAAYTKKWREANRERYNAYHREYYAKKKDVPVQRWIPVTERLPEKEGRYLCVKRIGKSGAVYVTMMNGDSYGFSMEHIYTDDVTHWMPLPEPPKEDAE